MEKKKLSINKKKVVSLSKGDLSKIKGGEVEFTKKTEVFCLSIVRNDCDGTSASCGLCGF